MPNERNDQSELRGTYVPRDVKSGSAFQSFKPAGIPLRQVVLIAAAVGAAIALLASCPWIVANLPHIF